MMMRQQLDVAMGNEAAGDGGAETMCCRRCGGGAIQIEFEGMNVRKAEVGVRPGSKEKEDVEERRKCCW
jgi:hypothetical protein